MNHQIKVDNDAAQAKAQAESEATRIAQEKKANNGRVDVDRKGNDKTDK